MGACTGRAGLVMVTAVVAVLAGCEDKSDFFGPLPGQPGGVQEFLLTQISTGVGVTCGIAANGGPAFCWGNNQTGALGIGTAAGPNDIRTRPVQVAGGLSFNAISTSGEHTCGITGAGQAFCWGANEHGELGTEATLQQCEVSIGAITSVPCATVPVPVAGGLTFASITTALDFTCGVTTGGQGYCWGDNDFGQLGTTAGLDNCTVIGVTAPCALTPVPVAGNLTFASINTGNTASHVCGVTTNGAAYCWGAAGVGQLGTTANLDTCTLFGQPIDCARTPVPVAGGHTFANVSAGGLASCGVTTGNDAFCWGSNQSAELGNSTVTTCPVQGVDFPCAPTPVPVEGGLDFTDVEVGSAHACGLTTASQAFCWGSNLNGAVGSTATPATCVIQGTTQDFPFDCFRTPVAVTVAASFLSIDAGDEYSCGIATTGEALCWGVNESGQLGDGTTTTRRTPVRVLPPETIT